MTMRVPDGGRLPRLRARRRRGFSLVELLVVVAILAILFIVGGQQITAVWKRQKLQSGATDLKVLMQRALPEMQRRNMQTFVQVGPLVSSGGAQYLPIYLVGDANTNGALDGFANPPTVANPDLLIDEYDIMVVGKTGVKGVTGVDQDFCLSVAATNQIQSVRWSVNTTPWTGARVLMCDYQGRAIDPTTGLQLVGPASLVLTHVGVLNKTFLPATRYILSVNPVWSVQVRKQIQNASSVWIDQQGG